MTDPLWVGYPRSYTKGRNRPVQFVVLHYTAGSEGPTSAEAGARYDKVRTDGTSTHYFVDSAGPALQEVPDGDRAHAARQHGNEIGIQIEMCGTAQTRAQWLDDTSMATMRTTAQLVALLLARHGLAFHRLTVAEARAAYYAPAGQRPTGIVEHATCTLAFPEDGGDHMDLGAGFPWDVFFTQIANGDLSDMDQYEHELLEAMAFRVDAFRQMTPTVGAGPYAGEPHAAVRAIMEIHAKVDQLALATGIDMDAFKQAVRAAVDEAIEAATPDIADAVADEQYDRQRD